MKDLIYIKDNAIDNSLVHRLRKAFEDEGQLTPEEVDTFKRESNVTFIDGSGKTTKYSNRGIHQGTSTDGIDLTKKNSNDLDIKRGVYWYDLVQDLETEMRYFIRDYIKNVVLTHDSDITGKKDTMIDVLDISNGLTFFPMHQIQHYPMNKGHFNNWHYDDTFDLQMTYNFPTNRLQDYSIRRLYVVMYYLNTVKEGGETEFRYADTAINPLEGTGVIFPAWYPYTHRANCPLSSDKLILTTWLCLDPSRKIAAHFNSKDKINSWANLPLIPKYI
tara:strand:+ start:329 stop:1153 length:825 start_codon:yes stop_codon:yes gene_type:complete